jgi:hypothetical protein
LQVRKFVRKRGGVAYTLNVAGKDAGEAVLLIDAKTRLPRKRTLTVHFPDGDMRVTETYRFPEK